MKQILNMSNHLIYLHYVKKADVEIRIIIFLASMYKAYMREYISK